jgi:hypothetical protein
MQPKADGQGPDRATALRPHQKNLLRIQHL